MRENEITPALPQIAQDFLLAEVKSGLLKIQDYLPSLEELGGEVCSQVWPQTLLKDS